MTNCKGALWFGSGNGVVWEWGMMGVGVDSRLRGNDVGGCTRRTVVAFLGEFLARTHEFLLDFVGFCRIVSNCRLMIGDCRLMIGDCMVVSPWVVVWTGLSGFVIGLW